MTAHPVTFASYARAIELGEAIPRQLLELVGDEATPYQVLRHLVSRAERRERGTFFTSSGTAANVWRDALETLGPDSVIVDPACGAGDLLAPALEWITATDLAGVVIRVCDVDEDLTRLAAARLRRALGTTPGVIEGYTRDFTTDSTSLKDASHVVLNPPFVPIRVDEIWATGRVNAAALFTVRALQAMPAGARLLAVLPDVLRSGSRYAAWRERVEELASLNRVEICDVFDEHTDVHVFTLDATVGSSRSLSAWSDRAVPGLTLGEFADVRVGPVVPHRDPEVGELCDYITARSLTAGEPLRRHFTGRKERGPFVLVNRTSRPGDTHRVRARLWSSGNEVAVENHLIIVSPKAGTTCEEILGVLSSAAAVDFLNDRIRCRHLTVRALREIPWQS